MCHALSSKNSFPDYGKDVSGRQLSGESSKTDGEGGNENRKDNDNLDNDSNDNRLHKEIETPNNGLQTEDDDNEFVHEKLLYIKIFMNRMRSKATQISVMQKILEIIFLQRKLRLMGTRWLSVSEI